MINIKSLMLIILFYLCVCFGWEYGWEDYGFEDGWEDEMKVHRFGSWNNAEIKIPELTSSSCAGSKESYEFMIVVDNSCSLDENECNVQKEMISGLLSKIKSDDDDNKVGYITYGSIGDEALVHVGLKDELNDDTIWYKEWITSSANKYCGGGKDGETDLYSGTMEAELQFEIYGELDSSKQKIILINNCKNTNQFCMDKDCNKLLCENARDSDHDYISINIAAAGHDNAVHEAYFSCLGDDRCHGRDINDKEEYSLIIDQCMSKICDGDDGAHDVTPQPPKSKQWESKTWESSKQWESSKTWETTKASEWPTAWPTSKPSTWPSEWPSKWPTAKPTNWPSIWPTNHPTAWPTEWPTQKPSNPPTNWPTKKPTDWPTSKPSDPPTNHPTDWPTQKPTDWPTAWPTNKPTAWPTKPPTNWPTNKPTDLPTKAPTNWPTDKPTTSEPTKWPTNWPTNKPTEWPTAWPTNKPSEWPTAWPTAKPTELPTNTPTDWPTAKPTDLPTNWPTKMPTKWVTEQPTKWPTKYPTKWETEQPTKWPTQYPTKWETPDTTKGVKTWDKEKDKEWNKDIQF
eukprot:470160_1